MSTVSLKGVADPAGRFARTRRKATQSEQKMNMSQLIAATRTPLVVTTEVSPIIEVPEFKDLERPAIYEIQFLLVLYRTENIMKRHRKGCYALNQESDNPKDVT